MEKVILYGGDADVIRCVSQVAEIKYITGFNEDKYNKFYHGYEYISPNRNELKKSKVLVCDGGNASSVISKFRDRGVNAETISKYLLYHIKCELNLEQTKFYLYGSIEDCRKLDGILSTVFGTEMIQGYATHEIRNIGVDKITGRTVKAITTVEKEICENTQIGIVAVFEKYGFELILRYVNEKTRQGGQFYVCSVSLNKVLWEKGDIENIFVPYKNCNRHSNIQFMLTRFCNLNCKLCSHFSPLDDKKSIYDFEQYKRDLRRVKELLNVDVIGLWGGEAFLCPNVEDYIAEARLIFSDSRIFIGSNGLEILRLRKEVLDALKINNVIVSVSLYPPTLDRIDEIKAFLDENGILQRYPQSTNITKFGRKYDPMGKNDKKAAWEWCDEKQCSTVFEGKIATCYFPLVADLYNRKFGDTFMVEENAVDLYADNLTSEKLVEILRNPIDACKYCSDMRWELWRPIGKVSNESDWII